MESTSSSMSVGNELASPDTIKKTGLKKIPPYWHPYRTMAKGRWFDREILELVSSEFRDRSVEYYRYALESGVTTINGKIAKPGTIVRNGDTIENIVHRHEPPVTSTPVQILYRDPDNQFIVINKPGSIPVHAAGRYFKNSLVEILKDEFGYKNVYTVNRLDRLTSGLMIIGLTANCARSLTEEFTAGLVKKEYIARVIGEFPEREVTCEEPLLTVDRQMGLNIVHPEGKHAKTIFKRLHYDEITNTSVLHCRPQTGRSHQIRVHLQFLGHSIANDPIYSSERIWGSKLGKGGIDTTPSDERSAPVPPPDYKDSVAEGRHRIIHPWSSGNAVASPSNKNSLLKKEKEKHNPAWRTKEESLALTGGVETVEAPKILPRETGHDIGLGSPVPLSSEAVGIITRLRNQKDEDEDWSRWRDVVFRAKGALKPRNVGAIPSANQRDYISHDQTNPGADTTFEPHNRANSSAEQDTESGLVDSFNNVTLTSKATKDSQPEVTENADLPYCPECYLPLHPDPNPEKLYIFLHAIRYTTSLGSFETDMPEWAAKGFQWDM
ncbi:pseudouridine synthase [Schizopora paradoxa]|uniref:Pseudouridine synthase n=1 Tax=Schizopora paradoxa TaxID=27342 RepID=A0A0H2RTW1_9AGAM|nr:pseudouridine synthase [Schizopora paradoxa]